MSPAKIQMMLSLLQAQGIPFVVIGGHAVNVHGYLRATEDVDIVFRRSTQSEEALLTALRTINAHWITSEIDPETGAERAVKVSREYIQTTHLMMLETELGYLDIFDYFPGNPKGDIEELFGAPLLVNNLPFVSLRMLRRLKKLSGRPKDLDDLENLPEE